MREDDLKYYWIFISVIGLILIPIVILIFAMTKVKKQLLCIFILIVCMCPAIFFQSYLKGYVLIDMGLLMFFGGSAYATYLHKCHFK